MLAAGLSPQVFSLVTSGEDMATVLGPRASCPHNSIGSSLGKQGETWDLLISVALMCLPPRGKGHPRGSGPSGWAVYLAQGGLRQEQHSGDLVLVPKEEQCLKQDTRQCKPSESSTQRWP